jgi:tRNA pseudouridine38-40 synthase
MFKYAALISYEGTRYCGWQKQRGSAAAGAPSLQEAVEAALRELSSEPEATVVGSGRTDAGVHAAGQVIHFVLRQRDWSPDIIQKGLNSILRIPPRAGSIQVLAVRRAPLEFHAQLSAVRKQYSYYFQQGPAALPFLEPYSWWIRKRLDLGAMRDSLERLRGRHDFAPFQASGGRVSSTVREILEAEITEVPPGFPGLTPLLVNPVSFVRVRLVGTGFLKQMVRGIAGTLLEVGEGRRPPSCTTEILTTLDRSLVGMTAPARGLWLERVWYPDWDWGAPGELSTLL